MNRQLFWDNGKESGSYYIAYWGLAPVQIKVRLVSLLINNRQLWPHSPLIPNHVVVAQKCHRTPSGEAIAGINKKWLMAFKSMCKFCSTLRIPETRSCFATLVPARMPGAVGAFGLKFSFQIQKYPGLRELRRGGGIHGPKSGRCVLPPHPPQRPEINLRSQLQTLTGAPLVERAPCFVMATRAPWQGPCSLSAS